MADKGKTEDKSPRQLRAEQNKKATEARHKEIDNKKGLSDDEKKILKLYDEGVQIYAIAKKVYKFVNHDTVGTVVLTIRKEHADDYNEVENVNSTKGYTGVQ